MIRKGKLWKRERSITISYPSQIRKHPRPPNFQQQQTRDILSTLKRPIKTILCQMTMAISLPIIDISPYLTPTSTPTQRQETAKAINHACTTYGFFYLTGHNIPETKLNQIISLARQFFATPLSEKNKLKRHDAGGPEGGDGARGYQAMGENVTGGMRDFHEAVDLYREWDYAEKEDGDGGPRTYKTLQGPNLWPKEPEELKDVYLAYIDQLQRVSAALVRAMGVALDLDSPTATPTSTQETTEDSEIFVRNSNKSFWVMRMIGYPQLSTPLASDDHADISQFSCGQHTDYGSVTLLLADPTPGALQVLCKDEVTWLDADPIPGAFVVNVGDMMERWSECSFYNLSNSFLPLYEKNVANIRSPITANGLWKSTKHRVIHRGDGYRVSVPFFYEPNFDALVKPLKKCVERTGGTPIHEGSTYGEYLMGKVFGNFYSS
jgi:isopenicillin N synthase-like dioxygenase